jgi:hypothetical protein
MLRQASSVFLDGFLDEQSDVFGAGQCREFAHLVQLVKEFFAHSASQHDLGLTLFRDNGFGFHRERM